MNLEFRELSSYEAYRLWEKFGEDLGIGHLRSTYGNYWIRQPVQGERVWVVYDKDENRVGWVAMRPDGVDPMVWQASGIFSPYRGHGYSKEMLLWSSDTSWAIWGVKVMLFEISNHVMLQSYIRYHYERIFNKTIPGEFVAGYINYPTPGYVIFGLERGK
jgi:hypothetical protein